MLSAGVCHKLNATSFEFNSARASPWSTNNYLWNCGFKPSLPKFCQKQAHRPPPTLHTASPALITKICISRCAFGPPRSLREQRNTVLASTNLHGQATLSVESAILLTAQHTCDHTVALRLGLLHTPMHQQLAHALTLKVRVYAANMQIPALGTVASPVLL
jgi:hypothetical protein